MIMVAVSQRTIQHASHDEFYDALDQQWAMFFQQCGIIPLLIPNNVNLAKALLNKVNINGILLTGGNDSKEREEVESFLLEYAINHDLRILGVCHGMQVIQRFFGVQLVKTPGHVNKAMEIIIHDQPCIVNSYHDYGSIDKGENFSVWATAYDGVIKAISHITKPIRGIMWHPERNMPLLDRDIKYIKNFYTQESLSEQIY